MKQDYFQMKYKFTKPFTWQHGNQLNSNYLIYNIIDNFSYFLAYELLTCVIA